MKPASVFATAMEEEEEREREEAEDLQRALAKQAQRAAGGRANPHRSEWGIAMRARADQQFAATPQSGGGGGGGGAREQEAGSGRATGEGGAAIGPGAALSQLRSRLQEHEQSMQRALSAKPASGPAAAVAQHSTGTVGRGRSASLGEGAAVPATPLLLLRDTWVCRLCRRGFEHRRAARKHVAHSAMHAQLAQRGPAAYRDRARERRKLWGQSAAPKMIGETRREQRERVEKEQAEARVRARHSGDKGAMGGMYGRVLTGVHPLPLLPLQANTEERKSLAVQSLAALTTPLPASNKGAAMLAKLGWSPGSGLGKRASGRTEPVNVISSAVSGGWLGASEARLGLGSQRDAAMDPVMQEAITVQPGDGLAVANRKRALARYVATACPEEAAAAIRGQGQGAGTEGDQGAPDTAGDAAGSGRAKGSAPAFVSVGQRQL